MEKLLLRPLTFFFNFRNEEIGFKAHPNQRLALHTMVTSISHPGGKHQQNAEITGPGSPKSQNIDIHPNCYIQKYFKVAKRLDLNCSHLKREMHVK